MGTNYYARILPSKERKDEIDDNDFNKIKDLIDKTYGRPYYNISENSFSGGEIHLGKRSSGWKFLWNPNWYKIPKRHLEKNTIIKELIAITILLMTVMIYSAIMI